VHWLEGDLKLVVSAWVCNASCLARHTISTK
jgi:hypothetical protein